jgi:hypothetical protein
MTEATMTEDRPAGSGEPTRNSAVLCLLVAVLIPSLGLVWALLNPKGDSPDEPAHVRYAAAAVRGDLGFGPQGTQIRIPEALRNERAAVCVIFHPTEPLWSCPVQPRPKSGQGLVLSSSPAAGYPPVYYAVVGLPTLATYDTWTWYEMRFIAVLVAGLLVGVPLAAGRRLFSAWTVLGVLLVTTPTVTFLLGSVNPDGAEIAASFGLGLSAIGLNLAVLRGSRREVLNTAICLSLTASYLFFARPFSFVEGVALLFAFGALTPPRVWRGLRDTRIAMIEMAAGSMVILGAAAVYAAGNHHLSTSSLQTSQVDFDPGHLGFRSLPRLLQGTIGIFGRNDYRLPPLVQDLGLLMIAAFVGYALLRANWWQRIVVAGTIAVAAVGLPILTGLIIYDGDVRQLQGRYQLPLVIGGTLAAALVLELVAWGRETNRPLTNPTRALRVVVGVVLAFQLLAWAATVIRYGAGMSRSAGVHFGTVFHGFLPTSVVVAVGIAITWVLGLFGAIWWQLRPRRAVGVEQAIR